MAAEEKKEGVEGKEQRERIYLPQAIFLSINWTDRIMGYVLRAGLRLGNTSIRQAQVGRQAGRHTTEFLTWRVWISPLSSNLALEIKANSVEIHNCVYSFFPPSLCSRFRVMLGRLWLWLWLWLWIWIPRLCSRYTFFRS